MFSPFSHATTHHNGTILGSKRIYVSRRIQRSMFRKGGKSHTTCTPSKHPLTTPHWKRIAQMAGNHDPYHIIIRKYLGYNASHTQGSEIRELLIFQTTHGWVYLRVLVAGWKMGSTFEKWHATRYAHVPYTHEHDPRSGMSKFQVWDV